MTVQTKKISPTYVSFYAAGSDSVEIPLDLDRVGGIISASDCLNIPALYWNDGDTTVTLGHASEIKETRAPDYDGMLETPNKVVLLFDAEVDEFMSIEVSTHKTRIRVWINHPTQPDEVVIAVGD
jgi:hypothetical protein